MVTATLPSMVFSKEIVEVKSQTIITPQTDGHGTSSSISSELTITPRMLQHHTSPSSRSTKQLPSRVAGIVGLFTGCGALLALAVFLRLPEVIQRTGRQPGQALTESYYILGALSLALSIICLIGLRRLNGEDGKGWSNLWYGKLEEKPSNAGGRLSSLWPLFDSIMLGFKNPLLGLGYLGGFVARASSVGISLFVPLYVNAYYISSGRCNQSARNPQEIKDHCRDAYVLAAELTGVSQLVALICAPAFGFLADRYRQHNAPLLVAALVGMLGYIALASLRSPMASGENGSPWIFIIMSLVGISQIGAIVCSLGLLGQCVLDLEAETSIGPKDHVKVASTQHPILTDSDHFPTTNGSGGIVTQGNIEEEAPLLGSQTTTQPRLNFKGSIAGVYSLAGGIGILLLTKAGGMLFDKVSPVAPFMILASFNLLLLVVGVGQNISTARAGQRRV